MAKRILSAIAITLFLSLANLGADAPLVTMDDAIRSSKESNISMEYAAAVLSKENRIISHRHSCPISHSMSQQGHPYHSILQELNMTRSRFRQELMPASVSQEA